MATLYLRIFFCRVGFHWEQRTQAHWPIALYLSFKFIGLFRSPHPLPREAIPLSLASFICSGCILAKPRVCVLTVSNTRLSHRMCTSISSSAPHHLHKGFFALLILCSIYCRLICRVRSPTNIRQYFMSLLMNWTYLLVGPSRYSWLVPYLSQTLHSVCFLFSTQFLILDLNLLKDSGGKGSRPIYLGPSSFPR